MTTERIDILSVMDADARAISCLIDECQSIWRAQIWEEHLVKHDQARAAVAELIAADKSYDYTKSRRIEAENRIVFGDRSDDAFRHQASVQHAYDRAADRRRAALANMEPQS